MEAGFSETESTTWVIRAFNFDNTIRDFITQNENSLIINIGAGLDTTFPRIGNKQIRWVNLYLPDVIELRKALIPDSEHEISIGKSVFDYSWINNIRKLSAGKSVMLFAAGVLFYFTEQQIKDLFAKLAEEYPGAHLVFDIFPEFIANSWNRELKKGENGKLDSSAAPMNWYLNRTSQLKTLMPSIEIIEDYPICSKIKNLKKWGRKMAFQLKVMDLLRLYNMIHINF